MSKIYMVKIGIVGNYNVGKTSFLNTYIDQESVSSQLSTIGVDFRHMIYNYDNKDFKSWALKNHPDKKHGDNTEEKRLPTVPKATNAFPVGLKLSLTTFQPFPALASLEPTVNSVPEEEIAWESPSRKLEANNVPYLCI